MNDSVNEENPKLPQKITDFYVLKTNAGDPIVWCKHKELFERILKIFIEEEIELPTKEVDVVYGTGHAIIVTSLETGFCDA